MKENISIAIANARAYLGDISSHAFHTRNAYITDLAQRGLEMLGQADESLFRAYDARFHLERGRNISDLDRHLASAYGLIVAATADNRVPLRKAGAGAATDLHEVRSMMKQGGAGNYRIERRHQVPALMLEGGRKVVKDRHSSCELPHYVGLAVAFDSRLNASYVVIGREGDRQSITNLQATTITEAAIEAQSLPVSIAALLAEASETQNEVVVDLAMQDLKRVSLPPLAPGHWYPCGEKFGTTEWMYITSVNDAAVCGFRGDPSTWSSQTESSTIALEELQAALPKLIEKALRESMSALDDMKRRGWKQKDIDLVSREVDMLMIMTGGGVPDNQYLDDRMFFNVWLRPAGDLQEEEAIAYVNGRTGDNYAEMRQADDGSYEYLGLARIAALQAIENDPKLEIVSVTLPMPNGAEPYLSPEAVRLLDWFQEQSESASAGMRP